MNRTEKHLATGSGNAVERALNAHDRTVSLNYQIPHCLILLVIILFHGTAFAQSPSITGRWKLDHDASTDSADELKGIRKSKVMPHRDPEPIVDSGGLGNTQKRYWQYANEGDEWRRSRELVHAGPLQRLLESNNLEIVADQDGYLFIYADGYERKVVPNPGGRVFTANGDELVQTAIGFTLAYWKDDVLVFETRIEKGGRLNEWVSVSPDGQKLSLRIEIDNRDWKWIAKINRLYDRVSGNDS